MVNTSDPTAGGCAQPLQSEPDRRSGFTAQALVPNQSSGTPSTPPVHRSIHQVLYDEWMQEDDNLLAPESLVAGAVAGFVSETAMHPFETLSTRAKVHPQSKYGGLLGAVRTIVREEGMRGVTAGISVTALVSAPQTAVYFWVYEAAKKWGLNCVPDAAFHPLVFFGAGAASELVSSMMFVPADVIRNRMQLGKNPHRATGGTIAHTTNYRSIVHGTRVILGTQGFRGLWVGWQSCMLQDCAFSALQFLVYEQYKLWLLQHRPLDQPLGASDTLIAGAVAGSAAALATNPLDVVTTRLMAQDSHQRYGSSIRSCLAQARSEGPLGLWRGALPRVLSVAPLAAIQFAVYEHVKSLWLAWDS